MTAIPPVSRYDYPAIPEPIAQRGMTILDAVYVRLLSGRRYTLAQLAEECGCSEATASARIRDVRKRGKGGLWTIEKQEVRRGIYEYRLEWNKDIETIAAITDEGGSSGHQEEVPEDAHAEDAP